MIGDSNERGSYLMINVITWMKIKKSESIIMKQKTQGPSEKIWNTTLWTDVTDNNVMDKKFIYEI